MAKKKMECTECGGKMRIDMEGVHIYGSGESPIVKLYCDKCKINRLEKRADIDTELAAENKCFIATAVYGPFAEEVSILRHYRDRVLLKNHIGKAFIYLYYKISPNLICVIKNNMNVLAFSRQILLPLVRYAQSRINKSKE